MLRESLRESDVRSIISKGLGLRLRPSTAAGPDGIRDGVAIEIKGSKIDLPSSLYQLWEYSRDYAGVELCLPVDSLSPGLVMGLKVIQSFLKSKYRDLKLHLVAKDQNWLKIATLKLNDLEEYLKKAMDRCIEDMGDKSWEFWWEFWREFWPRILNGLREQIKWEHYLDPRDIEFPPPPKEKLSLEEMLSRIEDQQGRDLAREVIGLIGEKLPQIQLIPIEYGYISLRVPNLRRVLGWIAVRKHGIGIEINSKDFPHRIKIASLDHFRDQILPILEKIHSQLK